MLKLIARKLKRQKPEVRELTAYECEIVSGGIVPPYAFDARKKKPK